MTNVYAMYMSRKFYLTGFEVAETLEKSLSSIPLTPHKQLASKFNYAQAALVVDKLESMRNQPEFSNSVLNSVTEIGIESTSVTKDYLTPLEQTQLIAEHELEIEWTWVENDDDDENEDLVCKVKDKKNKRVSAKYVTETPKARAEALQKALLQYANQLES